MFSNDTEKKQRWRETVDWACTNGCAKIIEQISEQDFYEVGKPTNYAVGPMGGPLYRPWDSEPKILPSNEELAKHPRRAVRFDLFEDGWERRQAEHAK